MTINDFHDWLFSAVAGQSIVYFSGELSLARDQEDRLGQVAIAEGRPLFRPVNDLADFVWRAAWIDGTIVLTQRRRHGQREPEGYDYLAHRTDKRLLPPLSTR